MFSFWNRRSNKSPVAGRTSSPPPPPPPPPPPEPGMEHPESSTRPPQPPPSPLQEQEVPSPPPQPAPERPVATVPNPHDAAVAEVHAKLAQVEQLSSPFRPDPLAEPSNRPPDPLFDPATGAHRGFFEPLSTNGLGDSDELRDEAWTHLTHIRELQSEIAAMHMNMEGIGSGVGSMDVEVDVDIDVDTVPTQEEEEAAKREKEFTRLPGRFKGRSDNIDAMMAKLDDLSQAVTAFHALQPPPLNFDSVPNSGVNSLPDEYVPPGDHATIRTKLGVLPATMFDSRIEPDENQVAEVLQDSPGPIDMPLPADVPTK